STVSSKSDPDLLPGFRAIDWSERCLDIELRCLKKLGTGFSRWPAEQIEALRAVAGGGEKLVPGRQGLADRTGDAAGHVLAALGTARTIKLDRVLPRDLRHARLAGGGAAGHRSEPGATP